MQHLLLDILTRSGENALCSQMSLQVIHSLFLTLQLDAGLKALTHFDNTNDTETPYMRLFRWLLERGRRDREDGAPEPETREEAEPPRGSNSLGTPYTSHAKRAKLAQGGTDGPAKLPFISLGSLGGKQTSNSLPGKVSSGRQGTRVLRAMRLVLAHLHAYELGAALSITINLFAYLASLIKNTAHSSIPTLYFTPFHVIL